MKRLPLLVALLLAGCATGRLRVQTPDTQVDLVCNTSGHAQCDAATPTVHVHMEGGALSNNLTELLGNVVTTFGAMYGAGVVP